jgi:glutathione S-transferase
MPFEEAFSPRETEQHLKLHAFGRIPILDDDGFVLYETQAILRFPKSPRRRSRLAIS